MVGADGHEIGPGPRIIIIAQADGTTMMDVRVGLYFMVHEMRYERGVVRTRHAVSLRPVNNRHCAGGWNGGGGCPGSFMVGTTRYE